MFARGLAFPGMVALRLCLSPERISAVLLTFNSGRVLDLTGHKGFWRLMWCIAAEQG
jgi:hypothetical protein